MFNKNYMKLIFLLCSVFIILLTSFVTLNSEISHEAIQERSKPKIMFSMDEANDIKTDSVSFRAADGSLRITIEPQGAIDAGAQWKRLCTPYWYNSGVTESNIPEGDEIVELKEIQGWIKPANQTVTIIGAITTEITVSYAQVTGTATFVNSGQNLGASWSWDASLGDLDEDGDLDAFVVNYGQGNKVWLNDGNGIFTDSLQSLGISYSYGMALGDLDCDGDLDAYVANSSFNSNYNKVWLNDGSGNFTDSGQFLGASDSFNVSLGDLDGDGDLDAFVANSTNNKVWMNDGSGSFIDSGQNLGSSPSKGVGLGDLDGDGDLDAFVANSNYNKVWLNDGSGNFTDSGQDLGISFSWDVSLGDLDGDGDLDAFVANDSNIEVWLNDGSGNFTDNGQNLVSDSPCDITLGDLDGDGDLDAFVGVYTPANKVWLNNGAGMFWDSGQNLSALTTRSVTLGDLNGDNSLDAFVSNESDFPNKVWLNTVSPFNLTIETGTGGTTVPSPGIYTYDSETEVTIRAIPDIHYDFSHWSGDVPQGHENDNPLTITIDSGKSITANFIQKQYTLTISAGIGGTTDPSPGAYSHPEGTDVTVDAIPSRMLLIGYRFSGWSGHASGTDDPITITMDSDKSIKANFTQIPSDDDGGGGLCFIAAAAYGSPKHPHVETLRDFRDKYLMSNKLGRKFVDFYYKYSPSVANIIAKHKPLRVIVQINLTPFAVFSYSMVHLGPIVTGWILLLILMLPVFFMYISRRR